jgi:hypothetical protein
VLKDSFYYKLNIQHMNCSLCLHIYILCIYIMYIYVYIYRYVCMLNNFVIFTKKIFLSYCCFRSYLVH